MAADWGLPTGFFLWGRVCPWAGSKGGPGFDSVMGKSLFKNVYGGKAHGSNCAEVISQLLVQSSAGRWYSVVGFIEKMLKQFISETLFYDSQSCFTSPVLVAFTCLKWLT